MSLLSCPDQPPQPPASPLLPCTLTACPGKSVSEPGCQCLQSHHKTDERSVLPLNLSQTRGQTSAFPWDHKYKIFSSTFLLSVLSTNYWVFLQIMPETDCWKTHNLQRGAVSSFQERLRWTFQCNLLVGEVVTDYKQTVNTHKKLWPCDDSHALSSLLTQNSPQL